MKKLLLFKAVLPLLVITLLVSCATSSVVKQAELKKAKEIPVNQTAKPLQFKRIVVKLPRGHKLGAIQEGILCIPNADLIWLGGRTTITGDEFTDIFREELVKANYNVVGDPNALFEDSSEWRAEFLVAGLVTEMLVNLCYPWSGFGNWTTGKGEAYMKVNWQIYSRLDRKVVYESTTEGSSKIDDSSPTGPTDVFLNAFAVATGNLLADKGFNDLVTGLKQITSASIPTSLTIIAVSQFQTPINDHINDIRTGVVTIFAGNGHGSGFFISPNGYILTSAHVVGGAKFVKIKLVTGRELVGEVIRSDKRRDVALIKIEESGMVPLPMLSHEINVGEDVFALGSPLDEKLSTTLSKGIVSGYRVEDGIRFLQSDVNVLPGSSGGPLVDSKGNVVAIAVSGIFLSDAVPTGLNFFVPIGEAVTALNVQITPK